jgi:diguanylate cyclase (GGDEF)-like protein/PAS domain S-box-containing protein
MSVSDRVYTPAKTPDPLAGALPIDSLPEPTILLAPDGSVRAVNDAAIELLGSAARLLSEPRGVLGDLSRLRRWLADPDAGASLVDRMRGRRENGVPITVDVSARRIETEEGTFAVCILRELCEDRLAGEAQLYFEIAFENAPIGMALFNTDGQYIRVNGALCELLGRSEDELLGRRDQEFTHPDDRAADVEAAWRILEGELDVWQCEKRFLRADGRVVWTIANLTFLRDGDGNPLSWVGQFQDISGRKRDEARLRDLAHRDPLTGAFNRRRLEAELRLRAQAGERGAVLVVDLDHFKQVNDAHGHAIGDRVLIEIAAALGAAVRREDLVARIGGDEFAILLAHATDEDARAVAGAVTMVVDSHRFEAAPGARISASVGIATFDPGGPLTMTDLLTRADRAMYRAKGQRSVRKRPAPA